MPFKEHEVGKGTIAYRGEDPEYWWRKSALWRPRRYAITAALAVLGLMLLGYAASPLAQHHQEAKVLTRTAVTPLDPEDRLGPHALIEVRILHEGAGGPTRIVAGTEALTDDTYRPGEIVTVTTGGAGRTVLGADDLLWPWIFGGVLVAVAAGRWVWDRRTADRLHYFR
ncbi:hypothetical protein [Kineosporia sp. A_224]|uniref:hypothetical protein n=1 Tax=Kineosporia sp. A_224 TaxID=1962180 RepID=UPI000B4C1468|nr:hypothetical protein [Kineosporia sp. A_224]